MSKWTKIGIGFLAVVGLSGLIVGLVPHQEFPELEEDK